MYGNRFRALVEQVTFTHAHCTQADGVPEKLQKLLANDDIPIDTRNLKCVWSTPDGTGHQSRTMHSQCKVCITNQVNGVHALMVCSGARKWDESENKESLTHPPHQSLYPVLPHWP